MSSEALISHFSYCCLQLVAWRLLRVLRLQPVLWHSWYAELLWAAASSPSHNHPSWHESAGWRLSGVHLVSAVSSLGSVLPKRSFSLAISGNRREKPAGGLVGVFHILLEKTLAEIGIQGKSTQSILAYFNSTN